MGQIWGVSKIRPFFLERVRRVSPNNFIWKAKDNPILSRLKVVGFGKFA